MKQQEELVINGTLNGLEQFGATFSNLSRVLSNNDTVSVRVFNADGCFDEKSLTFNQMSLIDNGVIALENSDDVDICEGDSPVGQIFGDGKWS